MDSQTVAEWTNGSKAVTTLQLDPSGSRWIEKCYRPGLAAAATMVREYIVTKIVSGRLDCVPKVLGLHWKRKKLCISYIEGTRVLEWVLERFADGTEDIHRFQSFHGMETDKYVLAAFDRFKQSASAEARDLKDAIRRSYSLFHRTGFQHGSADPRNMIYNRGTVFIIDMDHARPSFSRVQNDFKSISRWYGVHPSK